MTSDATVAGRSVPLDVAAVRAALKQNGRDREGHAGADGWLLYDFRGINPIAASVTGAGLQGGHLATRRWYYLIPASGEPRGLTHAIEPHALAHLPGTIEHYAGRTQLEASLQRLLSGMKRVAMEYSPECAIPYVSRVDAGTVELVRRCGVEVVSSGDLVQQFAAIWDEAEIASHREASEKLHRVKDRAFDMIARATRDHGSTSEHDVQQRMVEWFNEEGLVSDSPPNVSVGANAGNPHYLPTAASSRPIGSDELVLLDLWAKLTHPTAVFADITWMGYTGRRIPDRYVEAFTAVRAARDAAVTFVQQAVRAGRDVRGWEVDREASAQLRAAGYAEQILHRTGHSLGRSVHGDGVNMDDYETHDDRRLLTGPGFTIEPGVYFPDFGIRSEINVIMQPKDAVVTGPRQTDILPLV